MNPLPETFEGLPPSNPDLNLCLEWCDLFNVGRSCVNGKSLQVYTFGVAISSPTVAMSERSSNWPKKLQANSHLG
jgi:hypothetical protein